MSSVKQIMSVKQKQTNTAFTYSLNQTRDPSMNDGKQSIPALLSPAVLVPVFRSGRSEKKNQQWMEAGRWTTESVCGRARSEEPRERPVVARQKGRPTGCKTHRGVGRGRRARARGRVPTGAGAGVGDDPRPGVTTRGSLGNRPPRSDLDDSHDLQDGRQMGRPT
jgi:hypothetical protein